MRFILLATAVLIGSAFALAETAVSPAEAGKIKAAVEAWGCSGGEMTKGTDEDGDIFYEVKGAMCKEHGRFDLTLDKDFRVDDIERSDD
jgi:hypothetical protein